MLCFLSLGFSGLFFFFFKPKTAYEMRISDWSSDVCSSDLGRFGFLVHTLRRISQGNPRDTFPFNEWMADKQFILIRRKARRVGGCFQCLVLTGATVFPAISRVAKADRKSTRLNSSH